MDERFGLDRRVTLPGEFPLAGGGVLPELTIAYETYGKLNANRTNAILVCHALTGDQYLASAHPVTGKAGWWTRLVGPGKPVDPEHWFVICANVLGGCMGSTGPSSIDPRTGQPFRDEFPGDHHRRHGGSTGAAARSSGSRHAGGRVIGGSMGGMQALTWAVNHPARVKKVVAIATAARHSAQNIAFHEVGRQAIMADPMWGGRRLCRRQAAGGGPRGGAHGGAHHLSVGRRAHGEIRARRLQDRDAVSFGFDADFQVESYLRHQGLSFVERFDANSYLYITRAMDYFDLAQPHDGNLARAFTGVQSRFCLVSFTSDWLYPTAESRRIVRALNAAGAPVSFVELESPFGHDAFLLDAPEMNRVVNGFLTA